NTAQCHANPHPCLAVENPDPRTTLSEFLRGTLRLSGTKVMCHEGGCGCCVVTVHASHGPTRSPYSLAAYLCLAPLCSLDGHHVITVEGVGMVRARGLHPVQQRLVDHHGIQCGYCSPGFVMQMYSLLASNPAPSQQEVEDVFDGNICRCTGYRPILDAMKSFAKDGKAPLSPSCLDIEKSFQDLKFCPKNGRPCRGDHSCSSGEATAAAAGPVHLFAAADVKWFRPTSLTELLVAVEQLSGQSVKLVRGDTGKGVYKTDGPFQAYVDVKGVAELFAVSLEATGLRVGSSVSLNKLIGSLREHADQSESFAATAEHLSKVANQSVRNAGGWAGNLMMKHAHRDFVSDVFVVLEAAGTKIRISDVSSEAYLDLVQFLSKDMKGKDGGQRVVTAASLVYGGVAPGFVHAERAERFLLGKDVSSAATLQGVLLELEAELKPDSDPVAASPQYRKSLALSLFYKFYLSIAGDHAVSPRNRSACHGLGRPVSSGEQTYDTQPADYPLTQPMAKLEASLQ
uniref:FAD-binding PCMH-type domain-containing protein n=1 Tax=Petromyzon marinus TaxID=7757 RepID=S4RAN6_PETMA